MPHSLDLILTLAGGLTAALVLGFITQKLKLSPIVGYLFAGVVVGPFTPGFVAHQGIANQLAEIGIILLMFEVGLHFQVKELLAVRRVALPGALTGIVVATLLGALVARAFGWSTGAGVVFGLTIAIASTVVLLRVLADHDALQTRVGHIAVGWLVVEDLFTVLVLVLLPLFAGEGANRPASEVVVSVSVAVLKIAALVALVLVVGSRAVPVLLGYVAKTRSRELFTLTVLVLALGIAVGSAKVFGVSMALGAFLGGMAVGQSSFGTRAASEALPMRDAFAVLFFVSIGMLFDPSQLVANAPLTLATLGVVLFGKPLASFVVVRLLGHPVRVAAFLAVALAQIGEFSFVVAALGRHVGLLPESATQALVVTAIAAITLNPMLFRWAKSGVRWLESRRPSPHALLEVPDVADARHRAIVVGYGPVGRMVARLLRENEIEPTIIELNHETVASLRSQGVRALYGDAAQREILEQAGAKTAMSLVFAASGTEAAVVIRVAKELNPELTIVARAAYVREVAAATAAGADAVITAELEVALAMTERLLTDLGATNEQLDRARDRVRRELGDGAGDGKKPVKGVPLTAVDGPEAAR